MTARTCLTCAHGALRDPGNEHRDRSLRKMAAMGFINCTRSAGRATFCPLHDSCEHYQAAAPEVVKAREAWAAGRAKA